MGILWPLSENGPSSRSLVSPCKESKGSSSGLGLGGVGWGGRRKGCPGSGKTPTLRPLGQTGPHLRMESDLGEGASENNHSWKAP